MHAGNDAGDPEYAQEGSDAALPRRKKAYLPGRGFESPERKKERINKENAEWEARSGPVTVRYKEGYGPK